MTIKKEKVVIIIPTYNEAPIIEETIFQVFEATHALSSFDTHILVFDSASTDQTTQIIQKLILTYSPHLHLQVEPHKTGLGSAYLQAMNYALNQLQADIVIEFDADLSHQPHYIEPMLNLLKNYDVVVGSRYITGGSIPKNWQLHRKIFSLLGNYVARFVLTQQYTDLTSGFRITRREILAKVLPQQFLSNHYAYKLHLFWLLHRHGARIVEFPIQFIDRCEGYSKLPSNSVFDSLRVISKLRIDAIQEYVKKWFTH